MQAYIEKEDSKKLKQKQKERMQPKMGKMDIDYQVSFVFLPSCFTILFYLHFMLIHMFYTYFNSYFLIVIFLGC